MSSTVVTVALILVPTGLFVALLRAPHWFSRSLHRHILWRLRDEIADDVIDGRLPQQHPAVRGLLRRAERVIELTSEMTMLDLFVWSWVWKRSDPKLREASRRPEISRAGLSEPQIALVNKYHERLGMLSSSSILFGTWLGIASILRFVVPALREGRRRQTCKPPTGNLEKEFKVTIWTAAGKATACTSMGRHSRDFVAQESEDLHLTGVA